MKKLLLFIFAIVAFAACEQAPIEEQSAVRQDAPETITVGFEGDDTRIQLNEAQKTVWTKGDLVSVFYRSNANQQWKYDGETGARTAELKRVDAGTATRDMDRVVVVYPYNEDYYINPETYNVQASLPAVQNYLKDSYGTNGNIMISSSEYNQFSLKSVCGWLKLQLTGDGETIKSIKFRGNDGEQVAGELYINSTDATTALASDMGDADDNTAGGNLVFEDTILTDVTLDCGEGVALGKNATAFYIALPPQTFEQGFTIEIACADGSKMVKSSNKVLSIERNHIQPMVELSYTASISPSNQIWYTATSKIEPYYSQNSYWPDYYDITSNEWDETTGKGVITFSDEVSSIGQHAFSDMSSLKGITLPNSITYINSYAFEDCSNLTSVTIPNSVTGIGIRAFKDCNRLEDFKGKFASADGNCLIVNGVLNSFAPAGITEYTIPGSVTEIGVWVFNQYSELTSIIIPTSVIKIGEGAFAYCSGITDITIPNNVTEIGEYAFYLCTQLENIYVTCVTPPSVGDDILSNNMQNTTIYVPAESVKDYMSHSEWCAYAIVGYDFETGKIVETEQPNNQIWYTSSDDNVVTPYYTNVFGATIKSNRYSNGKGVITFDNSITTIGERAFFNCDNLTSITIPDSVTTIGDDAFASCSSLTSVTIPDSVTSIGKWAFYYCTKLTSVTIPDSVTTIGSQAFRNCASLTEFKGKFASEDGRCLIVNGILNSFAPGGLTEYTIHDSVTEIGNLAFCDCDNLTCVTIGDSVTSIGEDAFWSCDSLTSVNIPDSVTTIGYRAFYVCTSLTSIYCKATTPPSLGYSNVFDNNGSGRKIYVPAGSVNAYKSAYGWSEYASDIEGYDF